MQDWEKSGLLLAIIGAFIGLGKVLQSSEVLTLRLLIGRTLLGSGSSLVAGAIVMQIPDISPLALVGIGSALGIAGASVIEAWVRKKSGVDSNAN